MSSIHSWGNMTNVRLIMVWTELLDKEMDCYMVWIYTRH